MSSQNYKGLIGNSYIYEGNKIFIHNINTTEKFIKIYIDGGLLMFLKNEFEEKFMLRIESKINDLKIKDIINTKKHKDTMETNITTTEKHQTTTTNNHNKVVKFTFLDKPELLENALKGAEEVQKALLSSINSLKEAKTIEEIDNELNRAKGIEVMSNQMTSIINTKINAIQVISNID